MTEIASFFRQHGTKVLGYVTISISFLATADPTLVTDLLGKNGYRWILLLAGVLTAIRGHTNTAAIKDDIRVEEIAKEEIKVSKAVQAISDSTEGERHEA